MDQLPQALPRFCRVAPVQDADRCVCWDPLLVAPWPLVFQKNQQIGYVLRVNPSTALEVAVPLLAEPATGENRCEGILAKAACHSQMLEPLSGDQN